MNCISVTGAAPLILGMENWRQRGRSVQRGLTNTANCKYRGLSQFIVHGSENIRKVMRQQLGDFVSKTSKFYPLCFVRNN